LHILTEMDFFTPP